MEGSLAAHRCIYRSNTPVTPFTLTIQPGTPISDQIVHAAKRAIITGQLRAGDPFPSVRELSQALKINPNTAHRIVALLVDEKLLAVRPGIGTIVSDGPRGDAAGRRTVLDQDAERLVVEARRNGVSLGDLIAAIKRQWTRTTARGR